MISQPADVFVLQLAFFLYNFVCAFAYGTRTETQRYFYFLLQIRLMVTLFYFICEFLIILNAHHIGAVTVNEYLTDECDNNKFHLFLPVFPMFSYSIP